MIGASPHTFSEFPLCRGSSGEGPVSVLVRHKPLNPSVPLVTRREGAREGLPCGEGVEGVPRPVGVLEEGSAHRN